MTDFKRMAKERHNFVPKAPKIAQKDRHDEAMRILEEKRRVTHIPDSEKEVFKELTRMLLINGTLLVSMDALRRKEMIEELSKALFHGENTMAGIAKDVIAVLKSGMNMQPTASGNYQAHVYDKRVVYSYWHSQLIEIDWQTRKLKVMSPPAVVTAKRFMNVIAKAHEIELPKDVDQWTEFDIPVQIRELSETIGV